MKKNKILVIDIETTHVSYKKGSIVEIGATEINIDTLEINMVYESVCKEKILTAKHRKDPYGWIFDNSTLTIEMVRNAPSFENKVLPEFQKLINDYQLGCTAYNRNFDMTYLVDRGIVFKKLQSCPMLILAPIMKLPHKKRKGTGKWPSVEEVMKIYFNIPDYKEAHRAAADSFDEAGIISGLINRDLYEIR